MKKNWKKTIAILCTLVLVIHAIMPQMGVERVDASNTSEQYTSLDLSHFGFTKGPLQANTLVQSTEQGGSLQNVSIDGVYRFVKSAEQQCIYFGGNWQGIRLEPWSDGKLVFRYVNESYAFTSDYYEITPTEANMSLTETELFINMKFQFGEIVNNRTDLKVTVTIQDSFSKELLFSSVHVGTMQQTITMWSNAAAYPLGYTATNCEALDLYDYDFPEETVLTGGEMTRTLSTENSLDRTVIDGTYRFEKSTSGNVVHFGGSWQGARIETLDTGSLYVSYVGINGQVHGGEITPEESDMKLTEVDIHLKTSFHFTNTTDTTTDLRFGVTVNGTYTKYFWFKGVEVNTLLQSMFIYAASNMTLRLECYKEYEELNLCDFGIEDETIVDGEQVTKQISTDKTLHKTAVKGQYLFTKSASGNMIYFGGTWKGVRIEPLDNGSLLVRHIGEGDAITYGGEITVEEVGEQLTDTDVVMQVTFCIINQYDTTADVKVGVTINGHYTEYFQFNGVAMNTLQRVLFAYAEENTPVTLSSYFGANQKGLKLESGSQNLTEKYYEVLINMCGEGTEFTPISDWTTLEGVLLDGASTTCEVMSVDGSSTTQCYLRVYPTATIAENETHVLCVPTGIVLGDIQVARTFCVEVSAGTFIEHKGTDNGELIHDYVYVSAYDTTCTEDETLVETCTVNGCGATTGNTKKREGSAYGHSYLNGVCRRCKEKLTMLDITPYREAGQNEAGVYTEYEERTNQVFAGWFTGANCTKDTSLAISDKSGEAYAKYVDEDVMTVMASIPTTVSGTTKLRFVSTVDSLEYQEVGFYITVNGTTRRFGQTGVYEKIKVTDGDGVSFDKVPTDFSSDSKYFTTLTIKNITTDKYDTVIKAKPFWVTYDGTEVVGPEVVKTVTYGIAARNQYTEESLDEPNVKNHSYDFIGGTDVMPIVGFAGPSRIKDGEATIGEQTYKFPNHLTDNFFEVLKGAGINVIVNSEMNYDSDGVSVKKALELAESHGMGMLVYDHALLTNTFEQKQLNARINDYSGYKSYVGNMVTDEPWDEGGRFATEGDYTIQQIAPVYKQLNSFGYSHYTTLYPMNAGALQDRYTTYYLEPFITLCEPDYLSYNYYPFDNSADLSEASQYFRNLSTVRQVAADNDIPFWTFTQAGANWDGSVNGLVQGEGYSDNRPTKGGFYWSVGTQLAFGAKGIQYFPLIQPEYFAKIADENGNFIGYNFDRNGLVAADGSKTDWYGYAQSMSAQIGAVDEVLMNAEHMGMIFNAKEDHNGFWGSGAVSSVLDDIGYVSEVDSSWFVKKGNDKNAYYNGKDETIGWREITDVDGEAVIGCFNYEGRTALYVVNYDIVNSQDIVLTMDKAYATTVIQDANTSVYGTNSLTLSLEAGDSALVVFH